MGRSQRQRILGGLFVLIVALATLLLHEVVGTVFFAITVAYVVYPLRQWLLNRGLGRRTTAMVCTSVAFLAVGAIAAPVVVVLYSRRGELIALIRSVPETVEFTVAGTTTQIDVASLQQTVEGAIGDLAVDLASAIPVLALKLFLFALLVYALLLRPGRVKTALLRPIPQAYHSLVMAYHDRTRETLNAIYILQAATSLATFAIALPLFWVLGYESAFTMAVVAGILQFIPILGPSILIIGVAAVDALAGDVTGAVLVGVLGLVLIGFLPDALVRPRLAQLTAGMPGSLYFVGFVGGVLSVGVIGVIAGPLVVALLVETVRLLSEAAEPHQEQLS